MTYPTDHQAFNAWLNSKAKKAFTVRRIDLTTGNITLTKEIIPRSGDLVLARVIALGQHSGLQLATGQRSTLFPNDYIVLAYGDRYAPDQFEAFVPEHLGVCHLAAAGGIASEVHHSHASMEPPTQIEPVGLLVNANKQVMNVRDGALPLITESLSQRAKVIVSMGTSMNAGKTTTAAYLIRGFSQQGYQVAAAKLTGTGAPGDVNLMKDAGAEVVYDFTDMGYATTYRQPLEHLIESSCSMINHLNAVNPDVIILEIADGLLQHETAALITSEYFKPLVDGVVFSAGDSMGALHGIDWLAHHKLPLLAVSGRLTTSPLAMRETAMTTALPVFSIVDFMQSQVIHYLMNAMSNDVHRLSIIKPSIQRTNAQFNRRKTDHKAIYAIA